MVLNGPIYFTVSVYNVNQKPIALDLISNRKPAGCNLEIFTLGVINYTSY